MKIKIWRSILGVVVISLAALVIISRPVMAASYCADGSTRLGLAGCQGFFTGKVSSASDGQVGNIFDNGLEVSNYQDLINTIESRLGGSGQNQLGAAFIIDDMMGIGPYNSKTTGIQAAKNHETAWANLVTEYGTSKNSNINLNINATIAAPPLNSAYFSDIADVAFHTGDDAGSSINAIVFTNGSHQFIIERICGNVRGDTALPPITDSQPTGSVSVVCNAQNSLVISLKFNDDDGPTNAGVSLRNNANDVVLGPYRYEGLSNYTGTRTIDAGFNRDGGQFIYLVVFDYSPISGGVTTDSKTFIATTPACPASGNPSPNPTSSPSPNPTQKPNPTPKPGQSPTPTPPAPAAPSCGNLITSPSPLDPYEEYGLTVNVDYTRGQAPTGPYSTTIQIKQLSGPQGTTYSNSIINLPAAPNGSNELTSSTVVKIPPIGHTGTFGVSWVMTWSNGSITCNQAATNSQTFLVVDLPYLTVYGGDVATGASPSTGSTCNEGTATDAGIYSWNLDSASNYAGAGSQLATSALGQINQFATGLGPQSNPQTPTGLSFANSITNTSTGLFGGDFTTPSANCDFTELANTATSSLQDDSIITSETVSSPDDVVVVNGNVEITGNIVYKNGTTSYGSSISNIPSFTLIVKNGSIYIAPNVTELDGLYVAESSTDSGGNIYTCANGFAAFEYTSSSFGPTCNKQLTIYGSFIAKQVQFGRTYGSVGESSGPLINDSNNSAEVFKYSPEMWLPRTTGFPATLVPDTITELPPVL